METANWFYQEISSLAYDFFWNSIGTGLILGLGGLASGILLIVLANRRKLLNRPNKLWSFIAKVNYVYTPLCLAIIFTLTGTIFGAQRQLNQWIVQATSPIITYATDMLPAIQQMGAHIDNSLTLEEAIKEEFSMGQQASGYAGDFYDEFNTAYVRALLDEFGYPHEIDGFIRMLREQNLSQINAAVLQQIPFAIQDYCGSYFWKAYKWIWLAFLPYLLAPLAELAIFLLWARAQGNSLRAQARYVAEVESELV